VTDWLDGLGVMGASARDKFIPDALFSAPEPDVAAALSRLFAADGWASVQRTGAAQIGLASASERLARDVQHLLLRFGVIASLRARWIRYRGGQRRAWQLAITHRESLQAFADRIGIFGKEAAVSAVVDAIASRRPLRNTDLVPRDAWREIDPARGGESWASLGSRAVGAPLRPGRRALSRRRLAALADALGEARLDALARGDVYWDEIVSIEYLGRQQVYDLTVPGPHNFIADDVCVHNTALALNIAQNVALRGGAGVGVFSLEMSRGQLATRMLCAEARVDAGRVRTGFLSKEKDWPRLLDASETLYHAPLWIEDTPGLTITAVRSKARRLKAEHPELNLLVIDYLQLMQGSGGVRESREQAISSISRGLKGLAKELELPIIALSQLNRGVEGRPNKRPMVSDLRECVPGDTLVNLADGRRVPIRELVGETPRVLAMDPDGAIVEADSDEVWSVGTRPVKRLRLASGRALRATARHRVYTDQGWRRVDDVVPGDRVAIARRIPEPADATPWPDAHVILLGQLIGDGSYLSGQPMRYTTASEENSRAVTEAATAAFGATVKRYRGRGSWHQLLISGNGDRWHPAGVNRWLRELGVFGQRSHQKRVPAAAFRLPDRQIALLLRHLWATDGCVWVAPPESASHHRVYYATNSPGLAADVAALLSRLGIVARIRSAQKGGYRPGLTVDVSGAAGHRRFLDVVGAFGPKRGAAEELRCRLEGVAANTNVDTLPISFFGDVKATLRAGGMSHRAFVAARGVAFGGSAHFSFAPSRAMALESADLLEAPQLRRATDDLFWDRVVGVEDDGEEEVYDLTVPGPASWLADGIISHNSGAIEQDADIIMFIYRDEYYNEETEDKGIAEIIIAKQRNGPTGTVKLAFIGQHTRFDNLARDRDVPGGYA